MVAVLEEFATDISTDRIIASVKQIPLSAKTAVRHVHVLAEDVQRLVIDEIKEARYLLLAIDESTDNTDISQMCIFVRYFNGKDFKEELLALIPLEGLTTGAIIFDSLSGRVLHFSTLETVGHSKVTENMKTFITLLRENFSARFDDFAISRDVIGFVRDPFTFSPGGEFSANVRKVMPRTRWLFKVN
ncbi:hypothetical protein cypCar_00047648 [Cyprinus carpio]|nr:hypothetical protein cypCar_00047648 [Cyprinus carpio]